MGHLVGCLMHCERVKSRFLNFECQVWLTLRSARTSSSQPSNTDNTSSVEAAVVKDPSQTTVPSFEGSVVMATILTSLSWETGYTTMC
jgi:hypothetical protein